MQTTTSRDQLRAYRFWARMPRAAKGFSLLLVGSLIFLGFFGFYVSDSQLVSPALNGNVQSFAVLRHDEVQGSPKKLRSRYFQDEDSWNRPLGNDIGAVRNFKFSGVWEVNETVGRFTAQPECLNNLTLLVLITSSPNNAEKRRAIRQTWCSDRGGEAGLAVYRCVFLVGESPGDALDWGVEQEIVQHGDILRGNYIDSYKNLTLKVLSGLYWSSTNCQAQFVAKTDDDCFLNRGQLLPFLKRYHSNTHELYVGKVFVSEAETRVIRDRRSKWGVREEEYQPDHYPPYASGTGYLLSGDLLSSLLGVAPYTPPFPNEDAYIGVLASQLRIDPVHSTRFTLYSKGWRVCNFLYLFVLHRVQPHEQYELYKVAESVKTKCIEQKIITTWS